VSAVIAGLVGTALAVGGGVLVPGTAAAAGPSMEWRAGDPAVDGQDIDVVVPAGYCSVFWGLQGGAGGRGNGGTRGYVEGGYGGSVRAMMPVSPGEHLLLQVGGLGGAGYEDGHGGLSGSQASGGSASGGAGGGGATIVRRGTSTTAPLALVAGGGGGSGNYHGARGGDADATGHNGEDASSHAVAGGGRGGSTSAPGAGGSAEGGDAPRGGTAGAGAVGGPGAAGGGAGGGGLFAGGSGGVNTASGVTAGGGGGGGANYAAAGISPINNAVGGAANAGGSATATLYACTTPPVPVLDSATSTRAGEVDLRLHAGPDTGVAVTGYEYSVDGGLRWTPLTATTVDGVTSATVATLTPGRRYEVQVRAMAAGQAGQPSETVAVTVAVRPVVLDPDPDPDPDADVDGPVVPDPDADAGAPAAPGAPTTTPEPQPGAARVPAVPAAVPAAALTLTTDQGVISSVVPGQTLTVVGTGFAPLSPAKVIIYSAPVVLGAVTTDATGSFSVPVTVPAGLESGQHSLVASGFAPDGFERFLRMDVVIGATTVPGTGVPAATTDPAVTATGAGLAYTGASVLLPAVLGAVVLAGGLVLLLVSRRRRSA
jgi:hypothetical protein